MTDCSGLPVEVLWYQLQLASQGLIPLSFKFLFGLPGIVTDDNSETKGFV